LIALDHAGTRYGTLEQRCHCKTLELFLRIREMDHLSFIYI